jgi:hypothetical protein
MQISKYVSLKEATKSDYAIRKQINNIPDDGQLVAMKNVATNVFDKVREHFGKPIGISSFFRSKEINKAIGGSINSDHCNGCAIDIDADIFGGVTNKQIFEFIKSDLEFDQLLWEFGDSNEPAWVHVSLRSNGVNRKQVLEAVKIGGKTHYRNKQ